MSIYRNLGRIDEALYKCPWCLRSMEKEDSMIIETTKGPVRLCRDCQLKYYLNSIAEKNPGIDIKLKAADWSKNIKDGIDGRK